MINVMVGITRSKVIVVFGAFRPTMVHYKIRNTGQGPLKSLYKIIVETWSKGDVIVSAKSETWATASEGFYKIGIVKFRLKGRIFGGLMGIYGPVGKGWFLTFVSCRSLSKRNS